jgi:hypothetical protein
MDRPSYVHCYTSVAVVLVAASKNVVPVDQLVELARALTFNKVEIAQGTNQILALKRAGDTRWGYEPSFTKDKRI